MKVFSKFGVCVCKPMTLVDIEKESTTTSKDEDQLLPVTAANE